MPVVEELAKRFHVYALIMRFNGPTDGLNQGLYPGLFYFDFLLSQCSLSHSRTGAS